ncbi:hypothetical protein [Pseudohalioglobus lutimaris]|uniref:Uncharacterized protein n=1 Tax=Pseudohalioglobus lutimaris TaxID=1737061 RepID=A0A2N5X4N9_9GAMM|nr:hypothetical protein [Pseudohalioglobus lutimaris]PLW69458.1 hypothetical protein C0039_07990 [Pseudohalioglobus lutimaris]
MRLTIFLAIFFLNTSQANAETMGFDCHFDRYSMDGKTGEEDFKLSYLVDDESGKGYLMGNQGTSEVTVIPSEGQVTFIEVTTSGNVMTTTWVISGPAVHSRNTVFMGKLRGSQYYGSCEMK